MKNEDTLKEEVVDYLALHQQQKLEEIVLPQIPFNLGPPPIQIAPIFNDPKRNILLKQLKIKQDIKDEYQKNKHNIDPSLFQHPDRKWISRKEYIQSGKKIKNGKFSDQEIALLKQAVFKYVEEYNLGSDGLIKLVSQKHQGQIKGAWTTIAKVLPDRSVLSCYKIIRRKLNPLNYQGKWREDEEQKLVKLIEVHGRKWGIIAKQLQRTAENVRDKYKQMGEQNYQLRQSEWLVGELIELFKLIEKHTEYRFFNQEVGSLTYEEQTEPLPALKYMNPRKKSKPPEIEQKMNKLKNMINFDKCKDCQDIPWSTISHLLKTKSKDDCRNIWIQIIRNSDHSVEFNFQENLRLLQQARDQLPESIEQIQYNKINNGRTPVENEGQLKLLLNAYQKKILYSALDDMIAYFQQAHSVSKNPFQEFVNEYKEGYKEGCQQ